MLTSLLLLLIGLIAGTYGIMVGAGGGKIFVPALLIVLQLPPNIAAGTGIAVVFLSASSGVIGLFRQKRIFYKLGLILAISAIPGIFIGFWLAQISPSDVFHVLFACLLIGLGIFLLIKKLPSKEEKTESEVAATTESVEVAEIEAFGFTPLKIVELIFVGLFMGVVSSYFGMGGGWLLVPILIYLFRITPTYATATSVFSLFLYSIVGVLINVTHQNMDWSAVIWGGIGVLIGAQLGAILSNKISGKRIIQLLAVILIIVGVKLVMGSA